MTSPFALAQQRPPRVLGRALPEDGITLQWERITGLAKEITPLFREHWHEIALFQDSVPLEPNWDLYFQYEVAGLLHVLTVRADDILVGYAFLIVSPHLHYASSRYAHFDMFWLKPDFREGWLGYNLLKAGTAKAAALGAQVIYAAIKNHFQKDRGTIGRLLKRLGFSAEETVYYKRLG